MLPYTLSSPASGADPSSWGLIKEDPGDQHLWKQRKKKQIGQREAPSVACGQLWR